MSKFKKGDVVTAPDYDYGTFVLLSKSSSGFEAYNLDTGENIYLPLYTLEPTKRKPWTVLTTRVDGFDAAVASNGSRKVLTMGCRTFTNLKQAKDHWGPNGEHAEAYEEGDYGDSERVKMNEKRLKGMTKLYTRFQEENS